jgi:hypothetical protein
MNEKVNDTIITRLRIAVQEKQKSKWSTLLPDVIAKYSSTIHSTTGFMPKFLMFGIQDGNPNRSLLQTRRLAFERTESFKHKLKQVYDKTHKPLQLIIATHKEENTR